MEKPKLGRPTKYTDDMPQKIIEFFNREPFVIDKNKVKQQCVFPTFEKFAVQEGVHVDTLIEWTRVHDDFSEAYKRAKALQKNILITNGMEGLYNTTFAIFTAKNCTDMRDQKQIDHTTNGEQVNFTLPSNGREKSH